MTRRRRIAGLAALTALALSACASGDAKVSEARDAVREAGASAEQAQCVERRFEDEFSQDQLNTIAGAEELADIDPASLREQVQGILGECVGGETTTTAEAEGGEPSETTEGDGETTTTAAESTAG